MSLEAEVQKLTAAANEQTAASQSLAQEVAGKMSEIDTKVNEATQAVPDAVSAQAKVTLYVDINGSDETGSGKSTSPYKTIAHAISTTAYNSNVIIRLSGAEDSLTPHVIDALIDIGARKLTIQFMSNYLKLSDDIDVVFSGDNGSCLHFSDYGGRPQFILMDTNKTLFTTRGECLLHLGGYGSCNFHINDSAKLMLMQTNYSVDPRGVGRLTGARVNMKTRDGAAPAEAEVIGVDTREAGSVFVSYWQSALGNNYKDHANAAKVANLVGSLNVVSV